MLHRISQHVLDTAAQRVRISLDCDAGTGLEIDSCVIPGAAILVPDILDNGT